MGLFTHTKAAIQAGETALRIIGAGFIVSAVSVTSSGALEGLGKGTPSLLISLCRYVVVIIPAAFLLSRFFGAVGVWNAFWITEAITAIISLVIYRKAITVKIDLFPVPLQSHPFKKIACSHQLDLRQWLHA